MRHFFYIFTFISLFIVTHNAQGASVQGIVLDENGPAKNVRVKAYKTYEDLALKRDATLSQKGEKPGQYTLNIPKGRYYFTAHGTQGGTTLSSYHGLNPINIDVDSLWLPFFIVPDKKSTCEDGFQGVGGKVMYKNKPLQFGSISAYSIIDEPYRGMGVLTNTIAEDSSYWFDLEPGKYVIIARQRQDNTAIGPLNKGDLFCYSPDNPITVGPARSCTVDLACYPRDAIDTFLNKQAEDPRGKRQATRRTVSLESASLQQTKGGSSATFSIIAGRVTDSDNIPIPNLFVSAYPADDLFLFQMYIVRFKSNYIAQTDTNGMFRIEMPAGAYYLVARERVGEAPVSGEQYGLYEGTPNHSLQIKAGEAINGLQIITGPIMP